MAKKDSDSSTRKLKRPPSKATAEETRTARIEALTKVFEALGADNPQKWARSHVENGIDELGRFVLLRALWMKVVEPGKLLARAKKDKNVGAAVDRLMKNADLADLDALIRVTQIFALGDVLSVFDDPADNEEGIKWAIFRTDPKGLPLWSLDQLVNALGDAKPR
jgi:hypothetical protein